jgi:hypothetical protein
MFQVLTGLNLPPNDVCVHRFTDTVFTSLGQAGSGSGSISWEAFKSNAKTIETFLRTLGSRDVSCYHTPCSRKRGAGDVVFGSQKWRFITTMMLGLEFAVRGVQEQKLDQTSASASAGMPTPQPSPKSGGGGGSTGSTGSTGSAQGGPLFGEGPALPPLSLGLRQESSYLLNLGSGGAFGFGAGNGGGIVRGDSTVSSGDGSGAGLGLGLDSLSATGSSGGGGGAAGSTISSGSAPSYLERLRQDLQTRSCVKEVFVIPAGDDSRCQIASYGAEQFRTVRRACGICDDDFLLSVGIRQVIGSLLLGDLFGLSEQVSEGKSGSFFYWSQDGKYMVKTISRAESYQMRRMLAAYTDHLAAYPDTLLMRVLGLYRLKLNNDKWDLIIIQNIFGTSHGIHERFDLKGACGRAGGRAGFLALLCFAGREGDLVGLRWQGIRSVPSLLTHCIVTHRLDLRADGRRAEPRAAGHRDEGQGLPGAGAQDPRGTHAVGAAQDAGQDRLAVPGSLRGPRLQPPRRGAWLGRQWLAGRGRFSGWLLLPVHSLTHPYGPKPTCFLIPRAVRHSQVHYVDRGPPEDIWVAQQAEALEALYGDFRRLLESPEHSHPRFFQKEMDFERFAHYAYLHHHFDKAASLSLVPPSPRPGRRLAHGLGPDAPPVLDPHHGIRAYRSPQEQQDGEPDQLLFFGIIDLLVPFDSRKKGEYVLKSVYHKGRQDFSVIPPKDYRERFVRFVCDAIV